MENIFLHDTHKLLYFPSFGIYPTKINMYSELKHHFAKIFFNILIKSNIEFFVFAGSSIGLLRNSKNIPWVDDYDIIIFEENKNKLITLFPLFKEYNFDVAEHNKNNENSNSKSGGYQIYSKDIQISDYYSRFQCDVFLSKVEKINNIDYLKNIGEWGLYHIRNVPMSYVKPARWYKFEDMLLPFFNNVSKDVELEYGDIFDMAVLNVRHCPTEFIKGNWEKTYDKFNNYIKISIKNTKNKINNNKNLYKNRLIFNSDNYSTKFNIIDILYQISLLDVKEILINDDSYLMHICDIKFYYPDIKIITSNKNLLLNNKSLIDYFDEVLFDLSIEDLPYNYRFPIKIDCLENIPELKLVLNTKFNDFNFNNNFKYSLNNKKIINIKGSSAFDLLFENSPDNNQNLTNINIPNIKININNNNFSEPQHKSSQIKKINTKKNILTI